MKLYYRAVNQEGKVVTGIIEARDIKDAAIYLKKHNFVPLKIAQDRKQQLTDILPFLKKYSSKDLVFFTRQLASMLTAGLTLMQTLSILKNQIQNPAMSEIIQGIIASIEDGKPFSAAIEKYPDVFSPIYVSIIKAAESSGLMDKVLLKLADNLEKEEKLKNTIKGALLYPIIILTMMVGVMVVMLVFIMPKLNDLYSQLNVSLPLPTIIVLTISKLLITYWWIVIILTVLVSYYIRMWHKTDFGRRITEEILLKSPIFGQLIRESIMAEFSRTFGMMIGTGSLVVDSLLKSADTVGNITYHDAIVIVAKRVEKGIAIGDAMEATNLFPPIFVEMVKIGEQTGKLDDSLSRVSEYFEREVEQRVKTLTTAMEPFIMVLLAGGVAFLIIAIITPIYKLISSFQ